MRVIRARTARATEKREAREGRLRSVRAEAQQMLSEYGVTKPEQIDLGLMAGGLGAEVVYDDLDGAIARVVRIGSLATIRISNRIQDVGAQRFSIAHEIAHLRLGHIVPPGDANRVLERVCTPLRADGTNAEREASVFSSETVMPEQLVKPRCAVSRVTLEPVRAIAAEFTTSVLASAMRLVELSDERCAVVYSELGRVRWLKRSTTFPAWIPKGRRLDPASAAFEYFDRGSIDPEAQVLGADAWLPRDRIDGSHPEIVEHAALVPEVGAVFSLLWIPPADAAHLEPAA